MRLSQTCRSTESARAGTREGRWGKERKNAHRNILVLATAIYVIVARGDAEY